MMIGRTTTRGMALALLLLAWPVAARAQSAIVGAVKDSTGGVLPGVTVEASSPALIEKVRSVVTDDQGLYRLVDLRPGSYTVTFTLTGFAIVRREGVDLPASFTATINAELGVGDLQETVTIVGGAPTVDVQTVSQQTVLQQSVLDALPAARNPSAFVPLLPGVVGGLGAIGRDTFQLQIHGGRPGESNIAIDGFTNRVAQGSGGAAVTYYPNQANTQEISVQTGGSTAEMQIAGIWTNIIPKEGGNELTGYLFATYGSESLQSDNLSDELRARGLTAVNKLQRLYDFNPAVGGRLLRDRLWFYSAGRKSDVTQYIAGLYYNKTPTAWTYTPDFDRPAVVQITDDSLSSRLTFQATPRNKVSVFYDYQPHFNYQRNYASNVSPEATAYSPFLPNYFTQVVWKSPVTSRILLEAGVSGSVSDYNPRRQIDPVVSPDTVAATEQSTNFRYRAAWPVGDSAYGHHINRQWVYRAAVNYVTGAHAFKTGVNLMNGSVIFSDEANRDMAVSLLNGEPRTLTQMATPFSAQSDLKADLGLFVQDQWTLKRATLNLGIRYDYFNSSVPAQSLPAGTFVPARSYAAVANVPNWHDVSPRFGVSYDLFGDGRTALKATLNRYVAGQGTTVAFANHPVYTSVVSVDRSWTDTNRDFVPDCVLTNPLVNGECGQIADLNFGQSNARATQYDPDVLHGFGKRSYNWEVSSSVQHEVMKSVSVTAAYFRRWYGNFTVTDNRAVTPADFDPFCVTVPNDGRLSNSGQSACGYYDVNPSRFGQVQNFVTFAENFGKQREVYNGVDLTMSARLRDGLQLAGGVSTGRTETNNCFVVDSPQQELFCNVKPPLQPNIKLYGVYPLPWGLQTSAVFQSVPGPQITATYVATSALISPSLGRNLAAGANGTAALELLQPGSRYSDRVTQVDLRVAKNLRFGKARLLGSLDLFNAFNASAVQALNARLGPVWLQPTQILGARYLRFSVQLDF